MSSTIQISTKSHSCIQETAQEVSKPIAQERKCHPSISTRVHPGSSYAQKSVQFLPLFLCRPMLPSETVPSSCQISLTNPTSITRSVGTLKFAIFVRVLSLNHKKMCNRIFLAHPPPGLIFICSLPMIYKTCRL